MLWKAIGFTAALMAVATLSGGNAMAAEAATSATAEIKEPVANRDFRAAWVATVGNIDWPSRKGLSTEEQKAEMIAILDKCVELNMNAIVFQVRPACDAIYKSDIEPWSPVITGTMGQAPEPFYDPLEFTVAEAHKRGLEVHCWFNPYRALTSGKLDGVSDNHITKTNPEMAKKYGNYYWLNPTDKRVQDLSLKVILDVVNRYDIDGVHMDDYFYPYPSYDEGKDFPDDNTWAEYQQAGGKLSRGDWRREAVDKFVELLYEEVHQAKAHVKVGISPFGIAKPGNPPEVKSGFSQYDELYADAQLWLNKGWVDYYTPQLYWAIASDQPYLYLCKWWIDQNTKNRHIWPGLYTSKFAGTTTTLSEIPSQIAATRFLGGTGNVHFSMKALLNNVNGISDELKKGVYSEQALVPATTWIEDKAPAKPKVELTTADDPETTDAVKISWQKGDDEEPWQWAVYSLEGKAWKLHVMPGTSTTLELKADAKGNMPTQVRVAAVDRNGNESDRAKVVVPAPSRVVIQDAAPREDQVR